MEVGNRGVKSALDGAEDASKEDENLASKRPKDLSKEPRKS